jgi:hypothetical protein
MNESPLDRPSEGVANHSLPSQGTEEKSSESLAGAAGSVEVVGEKRPEGQQGQASEKEKKQRKKGPLRKDNPAFAPQDLTDGRKKLDWKSRYQDPAAQHAIRQEAIYLGAHFAVLPFLILFIWLRGADCICGRSSVWAEQGHRITCLILAWLGGTLGGTLFSTKWLYHSIAKSLWHLDRRLWRFFTPHLSGALAFATFLIISSGLLPVIDNNKLDFEAVALSAGFIVGYFSDSATAKLTEVAETLFGSSRK